jgi:hypothetical protein
MAQEYTLFYNDYSICSIMVRYTIALCRRLPGEQLEIAETPVDIQHGGQLTEHYLCEVNPRGTVCHGRILITWDDQSEHDTGSCLDGRRRE